MQCANNLRQLGLALHNYHDVHNEFPAMNWQTRLAAGRHERIGVFPMLMPFIEQNSVWELITARPGRAVWEQNANADNPWNKRIPALLCPSDAPRINSQLQPTNYRINRGDMPVGFDWDIHRGLFGRGDIGPGTLHMGSITDGTSNTMAFAEGVIGTAENRPMVLGGIAMGIVLDPNNGMRPPQEWLAVRGAGGEFADGVVFNTRTNDLDTHILGRRWGDGCTSSNAVFTIIPPNGPTVSASASATGNPENWTAVAVSSHHPGGAGTIACDASYRFVTNSVNTTSENVARRAGVTAWGLGLTFANLDFPGSIGRYSGPSPYGVWGAYGTPAHGDLASL
jgi:hypothetical protein